MAAEKDARNDDVYVAVNYEAVKILILNKEGASGLIDLSHSTASIILKQANPGGTLSNWIRQYLASNKTQSQTDLSVDKGVLYFQLDSKDKQTVAAKADWFTLTHHESNLYGTSGVHLHKQVRFSKQSCILITT
jgi:hypothetical protein